MVGILIIQLCIFSCKDKVIVGYNLLEMYLRTIGFFWGESKGMWGKITFGSAHFREGGEGHKKCTPCSLFKNIVIFTHAPCGSVGQQTDFFFLSFSFSSSFFTPPTCFS